MTPEREDYVATRVAIARVVAAYLNRRFLGRLVTPETRAEVQAGLTELLRGEHLADIDIRTGAITVALNEPTERIWQCRRDPSHPLITSVDEPRCSVCNSRCE